MSAVNGMTDRRIAFYSRVIADWLPDRQAKVLVLAGGENDKNVFVSLGFTNVVISNLDTRPSSDAFAPYKWQLLNAENLGCEDQEYDYVVIHAGLHHCSSPHRAVLEMYRVARNGVIFFESRDSVLIRLLQFLGITQTYETSAVYHNDCHYGGVNNTQIPNFIYRWTEREIEKTISSYVPYAKAKIMYKYGNDQATTPALMKGCVKKLIVTIAMPFYKILVTIFKRQQNLFACKIEKPKLPDDLYPWLMYGEGQNIQYNRQWAERKYR